jgi:hypothetical protein
MSFGGAVTRILTELKQGDERGRSGLIILIYAELRRMAARYVRSERSNHA